MPIRAILFDFDGTLADSYDAITASVNHVRGLHQLPAMTVAEIRSMVGHGLMQLMAEVIPHADPTVTAKEYREHHPTVMLTHTRLLPGVAESLIALQQRGVRMAVCSNKPSQFTRQILTGLGIDSYFDAVMGPEDAGFPKPNPAMVHLALAKLEIPTSEALYLGDMEVDVLTAKAAGVEVWVVPTGSNDVATLEKTKPDRLLQDMNDLIPALYAGS